MRPEDCWAHLKAVAPRFGRVRHVDEFARRLEISTGASAFSWGEKISAAVEPAPGGARVVVASGLRVGVNIAASGRNATNVGNLLRALSASLQGKQPPKPESSPVGTVLIVALVFGVLAYLAATGRF